MTASNGFNVAGLFAAAARANPDLIPRAALEVSREAFQRGRSRLPLSARRERAAQRAARQVRCQVCGAFATIQPEGIQCRTLRCGLLDHW